LKAESSRRAAKGNQGRYCYRTWLRDTATKAACIISRSVTVGGQQVGNVWYQHYDQCRIRHDFMSVCC